MAMNQASSSASQLTSKATAFIFICTAIKPLLYTESKGTYLFVG